MTPHQDLHRRVRAVEERAACLYRSFAETAGKAQDLSRLWRDLARDKEERVRRLAEVRPEAAFTSEGAPCLDGCGRAVAAMEQRLLAAEEQAVHGSDDTRLIAALDLEVTELDLLESVPFAAERSASQGLKTAVRVGSLVARYSDEVHVIMHAAELIARARGKLRGDRKTG